MVLCRFMTLITKLQEAALWQHSAIVVAQAQLVRPTYHQTHPIAVAMLVYCVWYCNRGQDTGVLTKKLSLS